MKNTLRSILSVSLLLLICSSCSIQNPLIEQSTIRSTQFENKAMPTQITTAHKRARVHKHTRNAQAWRLAGRWQSHHFLPAALPQKSTRRHTKEIQILFHMQHRRNVHTRINGTTSGSARAPTDRQTSSAPCDAGRRPAAFGRTRAASSSPPAWRLRRRLSRQYMKLIDGGAREWRKAESERKKRE